MIPRSVAADVDGPLRSRRQTADGLRHPAVAVGPGQLEIHSPQRADADIHRNVTLRVVAGTGIHKPRGDETVRSGFVDADLGAGHGGQPAAVTYAHVDR